ncbi:MAG: MoxR family ATPase [Bacteroidia bacterium]|nr:MoxR family ATPase [Bacteroidia bacterium]
MEHTPFESRLNIEEVLSSVEKVKDEFSKILVGQPEMVELMLAGILADGHILIEGVPGVAKTLSAKILAKTIDTGFSRIQFTPDLMPSDVLGTSIFNLKTAEFEFRQGPVFSNIVLIDEINRAPAKTQSALFEVMEERQITLDGTTYTMEQPFMVVATQNPVEQEGTYRLPEAQLDRFLFKIKVSYPSLQEEIEILNQFHHRKGLNDLSQIRPVLSKEQIKAFRQTVQTVHVDPKLFAYIAGIIQETRRSGDVFLGASPRATLYLMNASKALSVLRGRDFITPEDVKFMALPVLRHRIILTPEKEMEGLREDDIIKRIMEKIEVPR